MKKLILLFVLMLTVTMLASAQIDVNSKVKNKVNNRADQRTDEGIERGIDAMEEGVKDIFKKKDKKSTPKKNQSDETSEDDEVSEEKTTASKPGNQTAAPQKLESFTQYDFVAGDQVLFYEDFSQDAIGDFPALWTTNGSGEVKTVNIAPGKWLHMNGDDAVYCYLNKVNFPSNFIVEFDIIPVDDFYGGYLLTLYEDNAEEREMNDDLYPGNRGIHINFSSASWDVSAYDNEKGADTKGRSEANPVVSEKVNHVIVWVQNRRLRIYHLGRKVVDLPTLVFTGSKFDKLRFSGWDRAAYPFISNIKVTTAATDTRSKLITEGKLISYGITFDVNSDKVKPESYGALKDIATVLKENADVRVRIVGHTDSDGDDAKNLDLSKRRAQSVKASLTKDFGIDAARLETDGKGEGQPVAPNNTAENKARNRRVEFIKL